MARGEDILDKVIIIGASVALDEFRPDVPLSMGIGLHAVSFDFAVLPET